MLEWLTVEQFEDWRAFYNRGPWGEERADLRNLVLATYLLAPYRSGDQAAELPEPVYPYFREPEDPDDVYAYFLELAERY